jgi:hypothetical protein
MLESRGAGGGGPFPGPLRFFSNSAERGPELHAPGNYQRQENLAGGPQGAGKNNFCFARGPRAMQCAQRMARCGEGTFPLRKQPPGARNAALSGPLWGGRCFPRPRAAPQFSCRWSFLSACHSGLCSQLDRKILTLPETARFARACPVRPPAQRPPPPLPPQGGPGAGEQKIRKSKIPKKIFHRKHGFSDAFGSLHRF